MHTDDSSRLGLPSASSFFRRVACPGSFWAERKAREEIEKSGAVEESNEAADEGTRGHAWLAARANNDDLTAATIWPNLNDWTRELCTRAWNRRTEFLDRFLPGWDSPENPAHALIERRLWVQQPSGKKIVSGQPDVFAHRNRICCIIDYKLGREPVEESETNWQLRVLAAAAKQSVDPDECIVLIIQPSLGEQLPALYDRQELESAERDVIEHGKATLKRTARRTAGDHCTYCAARGFCAEAKAFIEQAAIVKTGVGCLPEITKDATEAAITISTPEQCRDLWLKRRPVKWIMDAVVARLKGMTPEQLQTLGLKTKPGKLNTSYHSLDLLFDGLDLDWTGFLGCCDLSKDRFADALVKKYGLTKAAALRQAEMMLLEFRTDTRCADELTEL